MSSSYPYDAAASNPLDLAPEATYAFSRRSDVSICSLVATSSGASPNRCSCRLCKHYKGRVSCVPWFAYKDPRHRAALDEENLLVKSLDTVKYENIWYKLEVVGHTPARRSKHGAVMVGRRMFIVGGICSRGLLNDVQELDTATGEWREWTLWVPELAYPGPRCACHGLFLWDKKLIVVGGHVEPLNKILEVFAFELETRRWTRLEVGGEIPMARIGQSIVHIGSMLIMFGGEDARGQLRNDIQILDLRTLSWLPSSTIGSKPCPRKGHTSACFAGRYLWIFGGKSRTSYLNDVHCLDLRAMEWVATKPKGNVVPRAGHSSVIVGHRWYIVGGEYSDKEIIGTLVFDLPTQTWAMITTVSPNSPLANDGISIVSVQHRGRSFLITFGGHGFHHSNQYYQLQTGFQIQKVSRLRTFFSRLVSGKAPRRKIRHPERHSSRPPSGQTLDNPASPQPEEVAVQIQRHQQQQQQQQQQRPFLPSELKVAELAKPMPVPSRLSCASEIETSNQEMIEALVKDKEKIENKLEAALEKINKLQQEFVALQSKKQAGDDHLAAKTDDDDDEQAEMAEPEEKQIVVTV